MKPPFLGFIPPRKGWVKRQRKARALAGSEDGWVLVISDPGGDRQRPASGDR